MTRQPSYDPMKNYGTGSDIPLVNQFPGMPRQIMGLNTQQGLDNLLPAGIVLPYGGAIERIPSGWLLCNGQAVSRQNYTRLFTALGVAYGAGDGATFNVPDMRGRVPVGYDAGQTEFDALGETGGAKTHFHWQTTGSDNGTSYGEVNGAGSGHTDVVSVDRAIWTNSGRSTTGSRRDGTYDSSSLPPYVTLNYIIKT